MWTWTFPVPQHSVQCCVPCWSVTLFFAMGDAWAVDFAIGRVAATAAPAERAELVSLVLELLPYDGFQASELEKWIDCDHGRAYGARKMCATARGGEQDGGSNPPSWTASSSSDDDGGDDDNVSRDDGCCQLVGFIFACDFVDVTYIQAIGVAVSARRRGLARALHAAAYDDEPPISSSSRRRTWWAKISRENRASRSLFESFGYECRAHALTPPCLKRDADDSAHAPHELVASSSAPPPPHPRGCPDRLQRGHNSGRPTTARCHRRKRGGGALSRSGSTERHSLPADWDLYLNASGELSDRIRRLAICRPARVIGDVEAQARNTKKRCRADLLRQRGSSNSHQEATKKPRH